MSDSSPHTPRNGHVTSVKAKYDELGTYAAAGEFYGISAAMAWRIINEDYEPHDREIRARLRMDEQIVITVRRDGKGRFTSR